MKKWLGGLLAAYLALIVAARMTRNRPLMAMPVLLALILLQYALIAVILVAICRGVVIAVRFTVRKAKESQEQKQDTEPLDTQRL